MKSKGMKMENIDNLKFLCNKLKSGEYDGKDIMQAWIAIEELIKIISAKVNLTQEAIDDLKSFRNIGEKFNYMGITMIVESHYLYNINGGHPLLSAAYKNAYGELKHASFLRRELPALRAENPQK